MTATPAWLVPTARAVPWQPLAGVAACLLGVVLVAAVRGSWPVGVLDVAAAGLAAAVVAGLRDVAADLLAAVPTSASRRRARRQLLLVPAGLGTWLAYLAVGNLVSPDLGWPVGPVVALVATGCAVAAWAPDRLAVEAGVATPLLWMALARVSTELDGPLRALPAAYQDHPWIVTAAAVAALLMGRNR
ncbi:hypothetical protein GCM10023168_17880 [Fodinibacter luteus]|uniref:Uncharacterized protein n=1 Tax=Fodinibacter luteus TaxID=552064 RepID=A0ABP8KDL5_9MICO